MTLPTALQLPTPHVNNDPNEVHEEMMNQGLKLKMEGLIVLKQKKNMHSKQNIWDSNEICTRALPVR